MCLLHTTVSTALSTKRPIYIGDERSSSSFPFLFKFYILCQRQKKVARLQKKKKMNFIIYSIENENLKEQ